MAIYTVKFNDNAFDYCATILEDFVAYNALGVNTVSEYYETPYEIKQEESFSDYSIAKEYLDVLKVLLIDAGYKVEDKGNVLIIGEPWNEECISLETVEEPSRKIPKLASIYKAHKEKMASA